MFEIGNKYGVPAPLIMYAQSAMWKLVQKCIYYLDRELSDKIDDSKLKHLICNNYKTPIGIGVANDRRLYMSYKGMGGYVYLHSSGVAEYFEHIIIDCSLYKEDDIVSMSHIGHLNILSI